MENKPAHRRWMRYSLRSLFVIVTLLALYLGWAMNWIRQRREFLARPLSFSGPIVYQDGWPHLGEKKPSAPLGLRLLGEPGIGRIIFNPHPSKMKERKKLPPAEVERLINLFPEANMGIYLPVESFSTTHDWNFNLVPASEWLSKQKARASSEQANP